MIKYHIIILYKKSKLSQLLRTVNFPRNVDFFIDCFFFANNCNKKIYQQSTKIHWLTYYYTCNDTEVGQYQWQVILTYIRLLKEKGFIFYQNSLQKLICYHIHIASKVIYRKQTLLVVIFQMKLLFVQKRRKLYNIDNILQTIHRICSKDQSQPEVL